ncbi:MAG: DNA polymerase IV [Ruminococcaceae bacterium]|nr:DNA polymerase IV [Oscillospiraceae bacterium]
MERLVFHVDVNSAFLSWEASRIVRDGGEDIRLIPSVVGGDPKRRTGVVLAKSIPAKKLGIKTGEPLSASLRKCPDLFIAAPDFSLYEKNSKAFMDICREYTPVLEKFSIDECFLDMTGTHKIYPDPIKTANEIKDRIYSELGFTVNIGVGSNKLLAKMASDFEKPNKVHTLFINEIEQKMWPIPVRDLFSVGASSAAALERSRIYTIGDLAKRSLKSVQAILGVKLGELVHAYANGIDISPVKSEPEPAKGYSISTTLEQDINKFSEAKPILLMLADSVSARMRADGAKSLCIGVTVRTSDFKNSSHQKKLTEATDITSEIYSVSEKLLRELWNGYTPIRLIGLSLTSLTRGEGEQITFFIDEEKEKMRKIDKTVDSIRNKFGSDTVVRATSYKTDKTVGKKYKAQMENKEK